jgi:hypothetical protein
VLNRNYYEHSGDGLTSKLKPFHWQNSKHVRRSFLHHVNSTIVTTRPGRDRISVTVIAKISRQSVAIRRTEAGTTLSDDINPVKYNPVMSLSKTVVSVANRTTDRTADKEENVTLAHTNEALSLRHDPHGLCSVDGTF